MAFKIPFYALFGILLCGPAMAGSFEWNQHKVSACGEVKFEDFNGFTRYKIVVAENPKTGEDIAYYFRSVDLASSKKMESILRDRQNKEVHIIGWTQSSDAIDSVVEVSAVDSCDGLN